MRRFFKVLVRFALVLLVLLLLFILSVFIFKDSLLAKAQKTLSKQLNTEIEVSKLDISPISHLPYIGIHVDELRINGTQDSDLMHAESLDLFINPLDLFKDQMQISRFLISDGTIKIIKTASGSFNYQINDKAQEQSSSDLDFPDVQLKNIILIYDDQKDKTFFTIGLGEYLGSLKINDHGYTVSGKGTGLLDSLKLQKQTIFYQEPIDFDLAIEALEDKMTIKKCVLKAADNTLEITGYLDEEIDVRSELTLEDKSQLTAFVDSTYLSLLPDDVSIKTVHSGSLKEPLHKMIASGSGMQLSANFNGEIVRLDGKYLLPNGYKYLPTNIEIAEGQFHFANLKYNVTSNDPLRSITGSISGKNIVVKKDSLTANVEVKEIFADQEGFAFNELEIGTGETDINFNGNILHKDKRPTIEGVLYSDFTNPHDLMPWLEINSESTNQDFIDTELTVEIKELLWDKWKSRLVKNNLVVKNNMLTYAAYVETCDGDFSVKGTGSLMAPYRLKSEIEFKEIDVNALLTQFDNFGQEMITDKNLYGTIRGAALLDFIVDKSGMIDPQTSVAKIALNADKGKLVDLQLLQDFSTYVEAAELADVKFESMTNYFEWKNNRLQIPVLYIKNNAANFLISGYHDVNNRFAYNLQLNAGEVIAKKLGKKNKAKRKGWWNMYYYVHGFPNDFKVESNKKLVQRNIEDSFLDKENIFFDMIKTFGYNDILDHIEEWEDVPEYYDN